MSRTIEAPGSFWEYNDVRVNAAALVLLHLLRRPLPEVLAEAVMKPIGASDSWQWHGDTHSQVTIENRRVISVSGGGHLDLLLGNKGQNRLLRGHGDATFDDVTTDRLPVRTDTTQDLDLDGDGDLDLVVGNEDRNRLLINNGAGRFSDDSEARLPLRPAAEETRELSLGDADGDGDLDIVTANANVTMENGRRRVLDVPFRIYTNDGSGHYDQSPSALPETAVGKGFDIEVGDFDGDGLPDLYLAGRGSADRLLLRVPAGD